MNWENYFRQAKSLRLRPTVQAWIQSYQAKPYNKHLDCKTCGFPHSEHLMCNNAPFGEVQFGCQTYSITTGNVVWWVQFMEEHAPIGAFHWRDQRFFRRMKDGSVEVTFYTAFNNVPQKNVWIIPAEEWASICDAVKLPPEQRPEGSVRDGSLWRRV